MPLKENRGGKRKGAGRKKSAPYSVHQFNLDDELLKALKLKYGVRVLNAKFREFAVSLR